MYEILESAERDLSRLRAAPKRLAMIKRIWCHFFHREFTRPFNGEYVCLSCGVVWTAPYR